MPSELENAMARFRRQLLQQERAAASAMVRVYGESWRALRPAIEREIAGTVPKVGTRADFYTGTFASDISAQIEAELRRFAPYATQSVIATQQAAIDAALRNGPIAIEAAGGPAIAFNKLNPLAVEMLVGYASDGSPLQALFDAIGPDVAPHMTAVLAQGIALGQSPRVTAQQVRAAFGVGLNRALNISRTETLRAYRESTAQVYLANADILDGWIWVCACTRRSCASCWAMHGSLHPLDARLDDHPQGRCTAAPKVRDRPNRIGATGAERFDALSADDQRAILGPGMYEAWKDGRVSLSPTGANSIVGRHDDPRWGTMRHARPLRDFTD